MKPKNTSLFLFAIISLISSCSNPTDNTAAVNRDAATNNNAYKGYASQVQWGEHIVQIVGCGDCHTPKKMTAQGPVNDTALFLSGSPSQPLLPPATPDQVAKGMGATIDLTAWIGPWGKSFAANITSDSTGIGNWSEQQFINCMRKGLYKGIDSNRHLMPPMPWQYYAHMTDDEIKAVFAYLKTTKAVHNIVPMYQPPAMVKQ